MSRPGRHEVGARRKGEDEGTVVAAGATPQVVPRRVMGRYLVLVQGCPCGLIRHLPRDHSLPPEGKVDPGRGDAGGHGHGCAVGDGTHYPVARDVIVQLGVVADTVGV